MAELNGKNVILTNIPNYAVTDENCENLCYKALSNGICRVLTGPASLSAIAGFDGKGLSFGVSIAYPSGAVIPELKTAEMKDCEEAGKTDMFFVTCAQGFFASGHPDSLVQEMKACVKATEKPVYFIIEAADLSPDNLAFLVKTAKESGVAGLVLSTAFAPYDVLPDPDAALIRKIKDMAGDGLEIIAAGRNLKTRKAAEDALSAGADSVLINVKDGVFGV